MPPHGPLARQKPAIRCPGLNDQAQARTAVPFATAIITYDERHATHSWRIYLALSIPGRENRLSTEAIRPDALDG